MKYLIVCFILLIGVPFTGCQKEPIPVIKGTYFTNTHNPLFDFLEIEDIMLMRVTGTSEFIECDFFIDGTKFMVNDRNNNLGWMTWGFILEMDEREFTINLIDRNTGQYKEHRFYKL